MTSLDQLSISRILGSTVHPYSRGSFGGFGAVRGVGEMLANRPKPSSRLEPDASRDAKIVDAFKKTHRGFAVDRLLADPHLVREFIERAHKLGVDEPVALINRRLLRIRKAGDLNVETTAEDKRDLSPFLIPAELAFAQLTYRYDASYDDLLVDPEIGAAFDALASRLSRGGSAVDYRLAALHLRKNIRARRGDEAKKLLRFDVAELTHRWHSIGTVAELRLDQVPTYEGIFALAEPNRYLYLTRFPDMRQGLERFRDRTFLEAMGNRFWAPTPEQISLQLIRREDANGSTLRLLELKALEVYRPIFNLLPVT